jgi:hypothetical protein
LAPEQCLLLLKGLLQLLVLLNKLLQQRLLLLAWLVCSCADAMQLCKGRAAEAALPCLLLR